MDLLNFIKNAVEEDMPNGDITSENIIKDNKIVSGFTIVRSSYIVSGLNVAEEIYKYIDREIVFKSNYKNSELILKNEKLFEVKGPVISILKAERIVLNVLGRMMGIATATKKYVEKTRVKILDTRKTTPGIRFLEKQAVLDGGGFNHRFSLSDMVLIKENHITAAGGIKNALDRVSHLKNVKKEIEVRNLKEFSEALKYSPDIIMLDNMNLEDIDKAVNINKGKVKIEVSGGINLNNIEKYKGIDYISVGALTHSVSSADLSFLLEDL